MTLSPEPHRKLALKSSQWSKKLETLSDDESRIELMAQKLLDLLGDKPFFGEIFEAIEKGNAYPDVRTATMFDNELLLFLDPGRQFSVRLFLWGPGEFTPIHDHNSWGVYGCVAGKLEIVKYQREDDGHREGYARLKETRRFKLPPGETDFTHPLNQGIHQIGNPGEVTGVSLSIYGRPLRRPYINGFDIYKRQIYRIFSPKTKKKKLASEALKNLNHESER
jgi:predicted metal-dependent enzyme (double-stranded beta helix superfamily)